MDLMGACLFIVEAVVLLAIGMMVRDTAIALYRSHKRRKQEETEEWE